MSYEESNYQIIDKSINISLAEKVVSTHFEALITAFYVVNAIL